MFPPLAAATVAWRSLRHGGDIATTLRLARIAGGTTRRTSSRRNVHSSTIVLAGLPGDRLPTLKRLLGTENRILRILETYSGLSGLVAEHAVGSDNRQFDGTWSSSLTASTARGMPDIEAVDTSTRLAAVQETPAVTAKPKNSEAKEAFMEFLAVPRRPDSGPQATRTPQAARCSEDGDPLLLTPGRLALFCLLSRRRHRLNSLFFARTSSRAAHDFSTSQGGYDA
jgi:hypothetical protein